MSAPVTEAHRKLATDLCRKATGSNRAIHHVPQFAQLIADSEAKATAELRSEIAELKESVLVQQIFSDDRIRANEAEAILGKLQELHGCSQEMVVHWCGHAAKRSIGLDKVQAELAKVKTIIASIEEDGTEEHNAAVRLRQELATERARLKEMAAELAHCAGYIASVRTDRQITWHEELYALQTVEWAEGAVEIAEKANAVLEAHDAAMKEGAS